VPTFRTATVTELLEERPSLQRIATDLGRAYVLTQLVGTVSLGDRVVLNTTAVELGLGTGGWHVVHWNTAREAFEDPGPGHIMKLRYTSLQVDAGSTEEEGPPFDHDLAGMPVVVGSLHSQVPGVAAAIRATHPAARLVYVMTDGAALPIAISDLVHAVTQVGLVDVTITAGHAFGGDLEAVSVPSALALAKHRAHADAVIVAMGPGVVGTSSPLGTSAIEVAGILDAAAALGATPIAVLRMSDGDPRPRHQGVSHHSRTALDLTRSSVLVASPTEGAFEHARHDVRVLEGPDVPAQLRAFGLHITTMGRGPDEDPLFFRATAAAGALAAQHL
jgi:Protein of unknown function (DUF3866)